MNEKALRIGGVAVAYGLWIVLAPWLSIGALATLTVVRDEWTLRAVPATLLGVSLVTLVVSALLLRKARRLDLGVTGRARIFYGATASSIGALLQIALAVLLAIVLNDPGYIALGAPFDLMGLQSSYESTMSSIETVALGQGTWRALSLLRWAVLVAWIDDLVLAISLWFLIGQRFRRAFWIAVDVPLTAAFIFALWALPFAPPEEGQDPTLPGIALGIASLFAIRLFVRSLPPMLELIERSGFQALVAARMLRAKKSGFLTAIGFLSILAVSFSSCTLTTTLSVMGGFRDDLQRKILGNNAHVVVDLEYGTFEGWDPLLTRVRAMPGVVGASPYVSGEVMVTSASNLGGAILRGIDPERIGTVTDLPRNMRHGRLEYLLEPERLLHLSVDEMSGSVIGDRPPPPDLPPVGARPDASAALPDGGTALAFPPAMRDEPVEGPDHESLMRDIDAVLRELDREAVERGGEALADREGGDAPSEVEQDIEAGLASGARVRVTDSFGTFDEDDGFFAHEPPALQRPREVLPGLIVGQELARSLRLHVGDEVNVVSPIGDLGPAGPIPRSRPFRVAGIFYSGMYEYDMKVAYTDLATVQRFLSAGDGVTGIEVKVDDWERAELAAAEIRQAISRPDLRVRSWQEVNRNLFGALELEKLAMFITLGIAILVASFCIVGTLVLMVQEKGREVGILKAMGAEDRQIVGMFMLQGLLIGVVGAVTGLGLGWIVCFAAEHYGIVQLNPEVYYIDRLPIHTEPMEFVAVGVSAVIVCLLATIYPAILGSRLRPVDALRYN